MGVETGKVFWRESSAGRPRGDGVTEKLVWHVVKELGARLGVGKLAPHDRRRTCARLCRAVGGELEQIQFLLGHISVQRTEHYLGCTHRMAVSDWNGIEPNADQPTPEGWPTVLMKSGTKPFSRCLEIDVTANPRNGGRALASASHRSLRV